MPANIAVICIIKNTAKLIPINNAENLARSLTSSLKPMRRMPLYFMVSAPARQRYCCHYCCCSTSHRPVRRTALPYPDDVVQPLADKRCWRCATARQHSIHRHKPPARRGSSPATVPVLQLPPC